jgi:hypothetical protein
MRFLLQVFFMDQFLWALKIPWGHFKFVQKFPEIFATLCFSPVSTTLAIKLLQKYSPICDISQSRKHVYMS